MGFWVAMTKKGRADCTFPDRSKPAVPASPGAERPGSSAESIDFIGQDNVGKDRPLDETKVAFALLVFVKYRCAGDVGGHQVRSKLDAFEGDIQNLRDAGDHQGLGQPGHAHQQDMTARKDCGHDLFDDIGLADDDPAQLLDHLSAGLGKLLEIFANAIVGHGGGFLAEGESIFDADSL